MSDHDLDHLLAGAVDDVLETMFFSETFGSCELEPDLTAIEAFVSFSGAKSGSVSVRISEASARSLAASFLGESEGSLDDAPGSASSLRTQQHALRQHCYKDGV